MNRYDHAAAAAYLMTHHGATARLILDGDRFNPPVGIITEADIIQAAADGKDKVRVQELMSQNGPARVRLGAAGLRAGSPAGR
jgi:CBS domain-containing protein